MYSAKVTGKIQYRPGAWNGIRVGVFRTEGDVEEQIGEYERNYPTLFRTFYPFQKNGQDYALYSPRYTVTRVMELPSCKDLGGEEPDSWGFCPVDFYVPSYIDREYVDLQDNVHRHRVNEPKPEDLIARSTKWFPLGEETGERIEVEKPSYPTSPLLYYAFGFVAGCIWGDDGSWKIQYLDLSEVEKGIIKRDARFGYIEMPDSMNLREAVNLGDYHYDFTDDVSHITITHQKRFDLASGKMIDDDPFS